MVEKIKKEALLSQFDEPLLNESIEEILNKELKKNNKKIIVLDDDPTGVQTVHDISVYTDWTLESIKAGFSEQNPMFFILTNSRSFTSEKTTQVHREIAENILKVSKAQNKEFIIISRGDSTLRGHYPLETQILKDTLEKDSKVKMDGEIIFPYFKEGGRFTANNIHYVQQEEYLIPVGETEFAKDKTFSFCQSHLGDWIEEKTNGMFKSAYTTYITLDKIRKVDIEGILEQLLKVKNFQKVVVNALDYKDVKIFTIALLKAMARGKQFLFRTAASFVKVIGGMEDKPLLARNDIISEKNNNGGLIIIGSHVKKTTEQLEVLKTCKDIKFIEFNQHLILHPQKMQKEVDRVIQACEQSIRNGKTTVVYTRRERVDVKTSNVEEQLKISVRISDAVTSIIQNLRVRPNYIIAKGGITSSDIGVKGLMVKRAIVAGQIKLAIPVWIIKEESKFPHMPYIIFPGNVGNTNTLKEVVEFLK